MALLATACSAPEQVVKAGFHDRRVVARIVEFDEFTLRTRACAGEEVSLHADRLLHSKRQSASGFITYHGFSEFLIETARVVVKSEDHAGFSRLARCVSDMFEALGPQDGVLRAAETTKESGTEDVDRPIPSRALFEPFALIEETQAGRIELQARRARLLIESGVLVLEGPVHIHGFRGEPIEAKEAVLSPHEEGLFLPLGHRRRGGIPTAEAVFLLAASDRGFISSAGAPSRSYDDPLNRQERLVLTHYARHAPPSLQPFVHAMLLRLSAPAPLASRRQ